MAPGTKIFAVKVLDAAGSGTFSRIVCGIDWVTSTRTDADPSNDISVANMSLGGQGSPVKTCSTTTDAMHLAICGSVAAGVTYVVAAGNSGWDFDYASAPDVPAAYPEVLTVTAATDSDGAGGGGSPACRTNEVDDRYASYSNFASTSAGASHTVAAPGTCISSTWPGGGHAVSSGTSMAAPHVAGLAALCIAEEGVAGPCSGMTPAQIVQHVRTDAQAHSSAAYGFVGDPTRAVSNRYYGYMSWTAPAPAPAPSPTPTPTESPTPTPTSVSASPAGIKILTGSLRSGGATRLGADDNSYLEVNAGGSGTKVSSWQGSFTGVSNGLSVLSVRYKGRNSRSCTQTLAVWSWATGSWVQLDSRTVGTSEIDLQPSPGGTLADYVGGTSGDGELLLRVRCQATSGFTAQGDLLRISYLRP